MKAFLSLVLSLHKQNKKHQIVNVKPSTVSGLCGPLGPRHVVWEQGKEILKVIYRRYFNFVLEMFEAFPFRSSKQMVFEYIVHLSL